MDNVSKKQKVLILLIIIMSFIGVMTFSYAFFVYVKGGTKINKITTGTLILKLNESKGVNLVDSVPVTDEDGKNNDPYTFSLENSGTINSKYKIFIIHDEDDYAEDGCGDNRLSWDNIKYQIIKNGVASEPKILSSNSGIIDVGDLKSKETNMYSLRFWIDKDSNNEIMGKHFHGRIKIEAVLDNSTN